MSPNSIYIVVSSIFTIVIGYDVYNWLKGKKIVAPELRLERFRKKINSTVLIFGITLTGASILFHINILQYRSPIEYAQINTITLRDFKGHKIPTQTLDGENQFAFITTSIEYDLNSHELQIKSFFHPSRSYVFNENSSDKYLLQHELYHFHITEVFARKSRKELSTAKEIPGTGQIQKVIDINSHLESQMQLRYDDETYHGYILKQQKAWQLKIDSLLVLHNNFSQTTIKY